ncbi:unnamed protein product [Onchocerca flexuosa]|uniref:Protein CASP n=1 Tax=Onchocerca flexuosa TaxID=387005 RepID=A0A183GYD0_9BILA|nr:unnamed protein product [Onchocerca flexuosa]
MKPLVRNEKLHIKALNLKISSLEAEKTVLMTRNNELESRLIHLDKNISAASPIAPSTAVVTSGAMEASSNLGKITERQTSTEALQWSMPENVATVQGNFVLQLNL